MNTGVDKELDIIIKYIIDLESENSELSDRIAELESELEDAHDMISELSQ